MLQRTLNLGILAHVDAGKTTLTGRLLYAAGVVDEIGSFDLNPLICKEYLVRVAGRA